MTRVRPFDEAFENADSDSDVKATFRPLTTTLQIWGMYIPRNRKGYSRRLHWMYCSVVLVILWLNAVRVGILLKQATGFSESLTSTASFLILYICFAYSVTMTLITTTRKLDSLLDAMTVYHRKYGFAYSRKTLSRALSMYCITGIGSSILSTALIFYIWNLPGGETDRYLYPFENLSGTGKMAASGFLGAVMTVEGISIYQTGGLYFSFCYCLSKEFDSFNHKVKAYLNSKTGEKVDFRLYHADICKILRQANGILTHVVFGLFSSSLPLSCLLLYGVIAGSLPLQDLLLLLAVVLFVILMTFVIIILSAMLNGKAHGCLGDLIGCKLDGHSEKTLLIIAIFTRRLTGPPIGFHVYGLFTIEKSTILMTLGTLLTYAVTVLTFSP